MDRIMVIDDYYDYNFGKACISRLILYININGERFIFSTLAQTFCGIVVSNIFLIKTIWIRYVKVYVAEFYLPSLEKNLSE